ncbi:hypothetical protein Poly24_27250 [Rosistilla carotiformis]|uniref:Uncharacterized protein n=1 Tax=Rosistilla carotiformis TaxID=2528017 RepID=A0A518JTY2_9BACT|nr:hypothetical protein [Rosistilla carotiformis]QDV69011.1 hypothetical protein Poly24_27250 [Rosistilla carotiformis]
MDVVEMMEDQFPGCANGRRLRLLREAISDLVEQVLKTVNSSSTLPKGYLARNQATLQLARQQAAEMEANLQATEFAVTDSELSMAVRQGINVFEERSSQETSDWKILVF